MTDTPTTTAQAWQLVEGPSYERTHIGIVVGTREQAQTIASHMNGHRIERALANDDETIRPVGVVHDPLPAHLPELALRQGDRVRVQYDRGVADNVAPQYGEIRGIVAKASDDELVVGIHPADNRDGRMLAQAFAATLSDTLLDALYAALWQWRYGEGGRERLRVFQGAPELTKRLDVLLDAYSNAVGEVRPDGVELDEVAEQVLTDQLQAAAHTRRLLEHLEVEEVERIRVVDESGAYLRGVLARLPDGEIIVRVPQIVKRYGPRDGGKRTVVEHFHAVEDDGDAYVGPPRIVAIARFVVRPQDWAQHHHGSFGDDADGFATFIATLVQDVVAENPTLSAARVGHAVRIESDR